MSMRTFAFQNRLFLTYTIVVAAVVILFSAVLLVSTAEMSRRTELYHQQELYKRNLAEIETVLWQMERLATQIVSDNEILGVFIPLATDNDPGNYFEKNLMDAIRISSLLSSINGTDNYAARISVFNRHGDYVSTGTLYEDPQAVAQTLTGKHYDTMKARALSGERYSAILDFQQDRWSGNPNLRLMSLYRTLSSYTETVYGLVDIQVGADVFDQHAFWGNGQAESLLINREGGVVYPFVEMADAHETFAALFAEADAQNMDTVLLRTRLGGEDVLLMAAPVPPSDWLFVRILPAGALLAPYRSTLTTIALASAVLLCCLVLMIYYLAGRIARPLQSLSTTASGISLQTMQQSIAQTSIPYAMVEADALRQAFHTMLIRLDKSISMEIQAHMRALQSQMNPHFLFNMLSVVIESSEESGDARTVSMCMKLSAMLRYVADFNGDSAALSDELQHARNYLDLMKDRYEALFDYEIVVSGPIEGVTVPKMILQPLAENCFTHGFRECRPPWRVRIEATVDEARWRLRVTDNGDGVTEETVRQIHARVKAYSEDVATNYQSLRLGGMGLVNTLLRLSLSQGGAVDFAIGSGEDGGTVIQIGGNVHDPRADR